MTRRIVAVTFRIDRTPDAALAPNKAYRRGGQHPRRDAAAVLKEHCEKQIISALNENRITGPIFAGRVEVDAAVWWGREWTKPSATSRRDPTLRYRNHLDNDGLIAALKPAYDALETAGVLTNDRQIVRYHVSQDSDPAADGFMVITVRAIDGVDVEPCPACSRARFPARAADQFIGLYCQGCRRLWPASSRIS